MGALEHISLIESLGFPAAAVGLAIITRISALFFFLPGIAERTTPVKVKLAALLAVSLIMIPAVGAMPNESLTVSGAAVMIAAEAVAGILIGFSIRVAIFILQTAGAIASQSFSLAQLFGSGIDNQPESPISTLLMISGVVLFLVSGLHIEMINALISSYSIMPLGAFPGAGEAGQWAAERAAYAFAAALSLALPFVALGFIYNLAIGPANRAMPQLMVAFVGVPAVTLAGLVLLALTAPVLLNAWTGMVNEIVYTLMETAQ